MLSDCEFEMTEVKGVRSPRIHGVCLRDPLFPKPLGDLIVRHDERACAPGDGHRITDVVAVPVTDENEISVDGIGLDRGGGVISEERIDEYALSSRVKLPRAVS